METLKVALRAAGADLDDVLKTTVYVATHEQEDLLTAWEVVRRHFNDHDAPSALLGVSELG
jgi:enamine deaminase RidA (YjgF/YER057c/UK114 family)